ncbi:12207_t:CDS:1, partial [Entrophospora sp. SA101]
FMSLLRFLLTVSSLQPESFDEFIPLVMVMKALKPFTDSESNSDSINNLPVSDIWNHFEKNLN